MDLQVKHHLNQQLRIEREVQVFAVDARQVGKDAQGFAGVLLNGLIGRNAVSSRSDTWSGAL